MPPQIDSARARIFRGARSKGTTSQAELDLRSQFEEQLGSEFTVIHSVGWFGKGKQTVGEADFIIAHPKHGILIMEVKGGIVSLDRTNGESKWTTKDRNGRIDEIEDPCFQAERNRRALTKWFKQDPRTRNFHYAVFPAVALPDSYAPKDLRPDCPADIIIDITHIADLKQRILAIYQYWKGHADRDNLRMDGVPAVEALIELLIPVGHLKPRLLEYFEQERRKIDALTDGQKKLIRWLNYHKRAIIVGGAGSGKTMLAMQKASDLADADFRVLYLCFNKRLANWVGRAFVDEKRVTVAYYAQLVGIVRKWVGLPKAWKDEREFYERQDDFLHEGALHLKAPGSKNHDKLFDAIIVDEGQDFLDTWWIPLNDLLSDPEDPVFYVFMDHQQTLAAKIKELPFEAFQTTLDINVRNTRKIHEALLPYMSSNITMEAPGPEGRDIEYIPVASPADTHRALGSVLSRLTKDEGIQLDQIIVLSPLSGQSQWKENAPIGDFTVTWKGDVESIHVVRFSSITGFKGLESAVVILTEMDKVWGNKTNELVYIGLSRARHHVIVIGTLPPPIPRTG